MEWYWFDPIVFFALGHVLLFVGLRFTEPASRLRLPLTLLVIACSLTAVRGKVPALIPGGVGEEYVIGFIFHASHYLNLARLAPSQSVSPSKQSSWAFNQLFHARWHIAYIPQWRTPGNLPPSRGRFLLQRGADFIFCAAVLYVLMTFYPIIYMEDYLEVPDGFVRRLLFGSEDVDVTLRELLIRAYLCIACLAEPYFALRASHDFFSVIVVGFGDAVEKWPPLFGSVFDAFTMRNFYARFWHHLMRKAFTSHAIFFVTSVLHLPKSSQVSRYAIITTTFMISALLHILATPQQPFRCAVPSQVNYYLRIIGAIFFEDILIQCYKKYVRRSKRRGMMSNGHARANGHANGSAGNRKGSEPLNVAYSKISDKDETPIAWQWRILGYIWVFCFETWAVSKMVYFVTKCQRGLV